MKTLHLTFRALLAALFIVSINSIFLCAASSHAENYTSNSILEKASGISLYLDGGPNEDPLQPLRSLSPLHRLVIWSVSTEDPLRLTDGYRDADGEAQLGENPRCTDTGVSSRWSDHEVDCYWKLSTYFGQFWGPEGTGEFIDGMIWRKYYPDLSHKPHPSDIKNIFFITSGQAWPPNFEFSLFGPTRFPMGQGTTGVYDRWSINFKPKTAVPDSWMHATALKRDSLAVQLVERSYEYSPAKYSEDDTLLLIVPRHGINKAEIFRDTEEDEDRRQRQIAAWVDYLADQTDDFENVERAWFVGYSRGGVAVARLAKELLLRTRWATFQIYIGMGDAIDVHSSAVTGPSTSETPELHTCSHIIWGAEERPIDIFPYGCETSHPITGGYLRRFWPDEEFKEPWMRERLKVLNVVGHGGDDESVGIDGRPLKMWSLAYDWDVTLRDPTIVGALLPGVWYTPPKVHIGRWEFFWQVFNTTPHTPGSRYYQCDDEGYHLRFFFQQTGWDVNFIETTDVDRIYDCGAGWAELRDWPPEFQMRACIGSDSEHCGERGSED